MLLSTVLAACGGGMNIDRLAADRSITTGSVTSSARSDLPRPDLPQDVAADEITIRNALGAADLTQVGESGLAWANPLTGSHGQITGITERRENGLLCRDFSATRASYDGVGLYRGHTCLDPAGSWAMLSFGEV